MIDASLKSKCSRLLLQLFIRYENLNVVTLENFLNEGGLSNKHSLRGKLSKTAIVVSYPPSIRKCN